MKNLLHTRYQGMKDWRRPPSRDFKLRRGRPPPWLSDFAGKLIQDGVGVVFASPPAPYLPADSAKIDAYHQSVYYLRNELPVAQQFYMITNEEWRVMKQMFGSVPYPHLRILDGRIDAVALSNWDGVNSIAKIYYPVDVVNAMACFARESHSFLVAGTYPSVGIAINGMSAYLAKNGMQGKSIETDCRFTYRPPQH
jgi:hypothetical protein